MAAGTTIKVKRKAGAFSSTQLAAGELGLDTTNLILQFSPDGSAIRSIQNAIAVVHVRDEKSDGTDGGTFTANGWRTRDVNTIVADPGGLSSLSSNQITLDAGTWLIHARCPSFKINEHRARLYNITGAAVILVGGNQTSASSSNGANDAFIIGSFVLAAQSVLEIQHYGRATQSGNGYGVHDQITAGNEVYTEAIFLKLS